MHQLIYQTNPQWHEILEQAMTQLDANYLKALIDQENYLPQSQQLFAAFNHPLSSTRYILLGESPYPRLESANGYAFWDNAVQGLWGAKGFSTPVNRATSLRNLLKMLLVARGDLNTDCSQMAIATLDKTAYWDTAEAFFNGLINKGFLLLNASLVYRENKVNEDARQWRPFLQNLLNQLADKKVDVQLILFGRIAAQIDQAQRFSCLISEHPYNLSFIHNPNVLKFFKPLDLLGRHEVKYEY